MIADASNWGARRQRRPRRRRGFHTQAEILEPRQLLTVMSLSTTSVSLDEGTYLSSVGLAQITYDDEFSHTPTLSGADASCFEIIDDQLYLRPGILDDESQALLSVTLTVDASSQTFNLAVGDVNEAATIADLGDDITFLKNGAAQGLTTTATVADVDNTNFAGGTLTVALTANAQSTDLLSIQNQGTGSGQIGVGSPGIGGPGHTPPTIGFALPPPIGMGEETSGGNQDNSPADEVVFENPPTAWGQYWAGVGQVFSGYGKAATGVVSGGYQMVRHPIQTAQGLATAAANPVATAKVIIAEYKQKAQTLEGQGEIVGEILIDIALGGVGKALGEGAKASKLGKALSKVADDVTGLASEITGEAIDPARLAKLKKAFNAQGGVIDQSPDAQTYLHLRSAEGLTFDSKTIFCTFREHANLPVSRLPNFGAEAWNVSGSENHQPRSGWLHV